MSKKTSVILVDKISSIKLNPNEKSTYSFANYIPVGKRPNMFSFKVKHDTWRVYQWVYDKHKNFENPDDAIQFIEDMNGDYVCLGEDKQLYYCPSVSIYYSIGDEMHSNAIYFTTIEKATNFYNDITERIAAGAKFIKI
jgi:hypothetical protein